MGDRGGSSPSTRTISRRSLIRFCADRCFLLYSVIFPGEYGDIVKQPDGEDNNKVTIVDRIRVS